MGLLDDAIREHLELKRRRGADPGEVAREQHEALDPVPRGESADAEDESAPAEEVTPELDGDSDVPQLLAQEPAGREEQEPLQDAGPGSGETVELDMQSVFGEEAPPAAAEVLLEEDSLEWEVPGELAHEHSTDGADAHADPDESAEDVLEETPDFLRDTPEQERLWFEQRPPRDFDFDK